jgi:phosphatidylglycerol:prolipoprotein diacylglycerol transferase
MLRRYALREGMQERQLNSLTLWVLVTGFMGAHLFDVVMYQQQRLADEGVLLVLSLWDGISSFGGFIGGAIGLGIAAHGHGFAFGTAADATGVGLLPGFTIGRVGCTLVHDHLGRATTSALGIDYPREALNSRGLLAELHTDAAVIRAHNLAMYELAYLIPFCAVIMWLAFSRRPRPAGLLAALIGVGYAPVRFALDGLRLGTSDPRHLGLTFAQWGSAAALLGAGTVALVLWRRAPVAR